MTEECATSTAPPAGASSGKTPRGAFMEQVENVSSKLGAIKRMIFADDGDEEVKCTAVVDELKMKLEARNRVARGMDAFPWMCRIRPRRARRLQRFGDRARFNFACVLFLPLYRAPAAGATGSIISGFGDLCNNIAVDAMTRRPFSQS